MNKFKYILLGIFLLNQGIMQLSAAEGDPPEPGASLADNQYLIENARLLKLAGDNYTQGKYDDAINYAQESIKYALLSDEYVSAMDAIEAAQARMDWAKTTGVQRRYAQIYEQAEAAFAETLDAQSREVWGEAKEAALRVISILSELPDTPTPVLAAQYRVRNWNPRRDCLWNIAARPEVYGDPFQWRRIYNANKSKLPNPDNPNLILSGTVLDIPSIRGEVRSGILESD
jgi:nucleoid-associated protein YgaU